MQSFLQSVIMAALFVGIICVLLHYVLVRPRLERRHRDMQRILELAAVSIGATPYETADDAREMVKKIASFRNLVLRQPKTESLSTLEGTHFPRYWRDAHRVLAAMEREEMKRLGREIANHRLSDPHEIASLIATLDQVKLEYYCHYTEGEMERPDAREVIVASQRSSFWDRYPMFAQYCDRAQKRFNEYADRIFNSVTERGSSR